MDWLKITVSRYRKALYLKSKQILQGDESYCRTRTQSVTKVVIFILSTKYPITTPHCFHSTSRYASMVCVLPFRLRKVVPTPETTRPLL